jgi:transglutaminase-like putative cysteine protease
VKLQVRHTSVYDYADKVTLCRNVLHLRPRVTHRQVVIASGLDVSPEPDVFEERPDFFGNTTTWVAIERPHDRVTITAESTVDVGPGIAPQSSMTWEQARGRLASPRGDTDMDARQFVGESVMVQLEPRVSEITRTSFVESRPLHEALFDLSHLIHRDFRFDADSTYVGRSVLEVLDERRGVCQDFAHLMISAVRSLGLPAMYVSGYLLTRPPPGQERLVGADTSHAWVAAFVPDFGWLELDPTNDCLASERHVTLAFGRDYDDICPVRGVIQGGREQRMSVEVDVSEA